MGGGKADFKLLAAQRSEHDWSSVPGEELIAAPDDAPYASGVLVLIELTNSRQVKRHQEAGRTLVSVLQNFSSLSKKFKSQGEEIEQWKESLTYQSQALNRREMEIEAKQEQVDQAASELEKLDAQKQEIETHQQEIESQKSEVAQLQEELTRKNAELEGAWAHLNGEIQRFEEQKESAVPVGAAGLSDEQAEEMRSAIAQLTQNSVDTTAVDTELATVLDLVAHYQSDLAENQHQLAQKREEISNGQAALATQLETLTADKQALHDAESSLQTTQTHLQQQQALLGAKQEQNQLLTDQLKNQTDLHQRVYELLNATDKVRLSKKVDVAALEAMPEGELQSLVTSLEQDLDKMVRFVNDQEEELKLQQDDIDALKAKLDSVSDYDRLQLETEIAEEKDRHVMLNRTLVGQRRNLLEREEVLSQHRAVLLRRQGLAAEGTGAAADLEPVLDEIDALRATLGEQIQQVESEIAQLQTEIDSLKQSRQQQQQQLEEKQQAICASEESYNAQLQQLSEGQGQVTLYESLLGPLEERVVSFSQSLDAISSMIAEVRSAEAQQQTAIENAQRVIQSVASPEPALV